MIILEAHLTPQMGINANTESFLADLDYLNVTEDRFRLKRVKYQSFYKLETYNFMGVPLIKKIRQERHDRYHRKPDQLALLAMRTREFFRLAQSVE